MAKVVFEKIRVVGLKQHYKLLMQELHRRGVLELIGNPDLAAASTHKGSDHFGVFDEARVAFAVQFLSQYAKKSSVLSSILSGGKLVLTESEAKVRLSNFEKKSEEVVSRVEHLEEELVRGKNTQEKLESLYKEFLPYEKVDLQIGISCENKYVQTFFLEGKVKGLQLLVRELSGQSNLIDVKVLLKDSTRAVVRLICDKSVIETCQQIIADFNYVLVDWKGDFSEFEGKTPQVLLREVAKKITEAKEKQIALKEEAAILADHLEDLKILHEFTQWRNEKNQAQNDMYVSDRVFVFEAWIPRKNFSEIENWVNNIFVKEVVISAVDFNEEDVPPTLLDNEGVVASFESITAMYGAPGKKDVDPTAILTPFFIVFFGLCLSDVGYGSLVAIVSSMLLVFGKYDETLKKSLKFMLYCAISTIVGGVLLGGYFGMTPDQAPEFLRTTVQVGGETVTAFKGQILNPMEGNGPMILLGFALLLGVIQILTGLGVDIYRRWIIGDKIGAFADPGAWFFFLSSLLLFAVSSVVEISWLSPDVTKVLTIIGAIVLVITQGRSQKNWFLKPIFGVLGLYGITAYLSDLLSYSRIMALGLSTGVIGMAMNLTATVMGGLLPNPILGGIVVVFILLFGHSLNFFLSLLGAFVHSGRLQFIEFFGKFYEGDGRFFKPFVRKKKHLHFTSSS